jgi:hypothetical protein
MPAPYPVTNFSLYTAPTINVSRDGFIAGLDVACCVNFTGPSSAVVPTPASTRLLLLANTSLRYVQVSTQQPTLIAGQPSVNLGPGDQILYSFDGVNFVVQP